MPQNHRVIRLSFIDKSLRETTPRVQTAPKRHHSARTNGDLFPPKGVRETRLEVLPPWIETEYWGLTDLWVQAPTHLCCHSLVHCLVLAPLLIPPLLCLCTKPPLLDTPQSASVWHFLLFQVFCPSYKSGKSPLSPSCLVPLCGVTQIRTLMKGVGNDGELGLRGRLTPLTTRS